MSRPKQTGRSVRPGEEPDPIGIDGVAPLPGDEGSGPLVRVFGREEIRRLDRLATERYGIPSIVLMENASIGLGAQVLDLLVDLEADAPGRVLIVCGRGANGGDGLCAARHLAMERVEVVLALLGEDGAPAGDAGVHYGIAKAMGLPIVALGDEGAGDRLVALARERGPFDVCVDALVGTGPDRAIAGALASAIDGLNRAAEALEFAVVSVDVPSGMHADTGDALGDVGEGAVLADLTVTFAGVKRGFLTLPAQRLLGEVVVEPIGVPLALVAELGETIETVRHPGDEALGWSDRDADGGASVSGRGGVGGAPVD